MSCSLLLKCKLKALGKPCYYDDTESARVSERIGIEREVCCTVIKEIYSGGLEMNMARCVNQCSLHSTIVDFLS